MLVVYLCQHPGHQEKAEARAGGHPQHIAGAAIDVQGEHEPGEAHANDVEGPQGLLGISLGTVHNLGQPEAVGKKYDKLHVPAQQLQLSEWLRGPRKLASVQ